MRKLCQIQLGVKKGFDIKLSGDTINKSPLRCEGNSRTVMERSEQAAMKSDFLQPLPVLETEKRLHSNNNSSN